LKEWVQSSLEEIEEVLTKKLSSVCQFNIVHQKSKDILSNVDQLINIKQICALTVHYKRYFVLF